MRSLGRLAVCLLGGLAFAGQYVGAAAVDARSVQDGYSSNAHSNPLYKRQTSFTPVRGFTTVVERRSIRVLQSSYPDIFNMLILAWASVARRTEDNLVSYYQVAGMSSHYHHLQPVRGQADVLVKVSTEHRTSRGSIQVAPLLIRTLAIVPTRVRSS